MFLLYWEVYALMGLAVNLWHENLAFIEGGVYMCSNGGVGSRVISSVFMWFCASLWTPNVSACFKGM